MSSEHRETLIVGASGFVGASLMRAWAHDPLVATTGVTSNAWSDVRGRHYDRVVVAAPHAQKWWANQNPAEDRRKCEGLAEELSRLQANEIVLISTVDAGRTAGVADHPNDDAAPATPYGKHRRWLEKRVLENSPGARVLRLPALFGSGLKKNAIFDLANRRELYRHNLADTYQWYPIEWLPVDIERVFEFPFELVSISTQPMVLDTIVVRYFPELRHLFDERNAASPRRDPVLYCTRSCYADQWPSRRTDGFMYGADQVLTELDSYLMEFE